ncbi:30813_t:CDS:2 [Gigaspora margarita]|uniref:30813_t:CDS:1 n=1 Tax=Gigaspora margarita TaxID=4874 RepID=A0ABN7VKT1_GIGMA|nr:30813_t:CDS:2 [Gigaspora margarita]
MNKILLKSLNVVVSLLFIGASIFTLFTSKSFPSNSENNNATNAQNSTSLYTYLTPATYTFGILFVLYFWLVIFIIYQWFVDEGDDSEKYEIVVDGVSYYFIIAGILITAWFILWKFKLYIIAAIVHLLSFATVVYICYYIDFYYPTKGFLENLFIRKLFSIWAACSLYAVLLSFWIAIPALDTIPLSVIVLILLIIIGLFVVDYYPSRDFVFSLVIVWILIGVAIYSFKTFSVFTVTVLGIGLISGGILKAIVNLYMEQHRSMGILG